MGLGESPDTLLGANFHKELTMIFLGFSVRVAEEWYESDGSNPSCLRGLELARENRQQLETEQVRYTVL